MKFGKQPKRFGAPSDQFLAKSRPEILTPPTQGPVHLYVDSKRPVPKDWTAIRSPEEFFTLLDSGTDVVTRITHLSFDSYFGPTEINGFQVINRLADYFTMNEDFLPLLQAIGLHSVNREEAQRMDRLLADVLTPQRKMSLYVQWGTPRLDMTEIPKGLKTQTPPVRYIDRTHKDPEPTGS